MPGGRLPALVRRFRTPLGGEGSLLDERLLDRPEKLLADAVVVAANHDEFRGYEPLQLISELARPDALIVDPWNCFGAAQVFAYVTELSAMTNGRVALP